MKTRCPRCESETFDLGILNMEFKNRKMRVEYRLCPKCRLIFCEGT